MIGPKMQQVIEYVRANPGCPKIDAAREVGPNGSLYYGYRTVNRAIARGLIQAKRRPDGRYELTPAGRPVRAAGN